MVYNSPAQYAGEFSDIAAASMRHASPFGYANEFTPHHHGIAPTPVTPISPTVMSTEVNAVLDHAERVNTVAEKYRHEADIARAEAAQVRAQLEIERRSRPTTPLASTNFEHAVEAEANRRAYELAHHYAQVSEDALRVAQREREDARRHRYTPPPAAIIAGRHTPPGSPLMGGVSPRISMNGRITPPTMPTMMLGPGQTTMLMESPLGIGPHPLMASPPTASAQLLANPPGTISTHSPAVQQTTRTTVAVHDDFHRRLMALEQDLKMEREKNAFLQAERKRYESKHAADREQWQLEQDRLKDEIDLRTREPMYWQMRSVEDRRVMDAEYAQMRERVHALEAEKGDLRNQIAEYRNQAARLEATSKAKEMEIDSLERDNQQLAQENRKVVDDAHVKLCKLQEERDRAIHSHTRAHMAEISEAQSTADTYRMEADRLRAELIKERDQRRANEIQFQELKKTSELKNREFEADVTSRAEELVNTYKLIVENYEQQLQALRRHSGPLDTDVRQLAEKKMSFQTSHSPAAKQSTTTTEQISRSVRQTVA